MFIHRDGDADGYLVRITGNAVYLSAEHSTNLENLLIGAAVLSGVGTTPLLGEMGRFILKWFVFLPVIDFHSPLTLQSFNAEGNRTNAKLHKEAHIVFKITIGLILVAISLSASGSGVPKQALTKAASIVIPIIYILILGFATSILFRYRFTSWRIQKAFYIACAVFPFLAVRVIYLILSAWQVDNNKYNSFIGSVHVAAGMELAMEVIIIALYMASRFVLAPLEKKTDEETLQSNESFRGKEAPERA